MCYSAMVIDAFKAYARHNLLGMDLNEFEAAYFPEEREKRIDRIRRKRGKTPKGMDDWVRGERPDIGALIDERDAAEISKLEQEIFKQAKRLADGERCMQHKPTKKASEDVRIATNKIGQIKVKLGDLKRTESKPKDWRFFPGMWAPVIVSENGRRVVKPMRYGCRPAGKPAFYDTKYPGTYNARRDNLEGFWKGTFGVSHGLVVLSTFFENVEVDGKNQVLQFTPKDNSHMLVACLWSHWVDPTGEEPDLLSFAAITDDPEPEVAAAGHDRTIINIKPEHVDAWLNPNGDLRRMYAIFDDKQHPFYEHQIEKAA